MNFNKFMVEQVKSTNQQVNIKVDTAFSWVEITAKDCAESSVFMQGHEADDFIKQAKELSEEYTEESLDNCYAYLAYEYLDVVFHG